MNSPASGARKVTGRRRADLVTPERPPTDSADGTEGPSIPPGWCRLCWHDKFICLDGQWWLQHIGSYSACTHPCHTDDTFLGSTS